MKKSRKKIKNKSDIAAVQNLLSQAEQLGDSESQKRSELLARACSKCVAHWRSPASSGKDKAWIDVSLKIHQDYLIQTNDEMSADERDSVELANLCWEMLNDPKRRGDLSDLQINEYKSQFEEGLSWESEEEERLEPGDTKKSQLAEPRDGSAGTFLGLQSKILDLMKRTEQYCRLPAILSDMPTSAQQQGETRMPQLPEIMAKQMIDQCRNVLSTLKKADDVQFKTHVSVTITALMYLIHVLDHREPNEQVFQLKLEILNFNQELVNLFAPPYDLFVVQRDIYFHHVINYFRSKKINEVDPYNHLKVILYEEIKQPHLLSRELEASFMVADLCMSNFIHAGKFEPELLILIDGLSTKISNNFITWWSIFSSSYEQKWKSLLYCRVLNNILVTIEFFLGASKPNYAEKLITFANTLANYLQNFHPIESDCLAILNRLAELNRIYPQLSQDNPSIGFILSKLTVGFSYIRSLADTKKTPQAPVITVPEKKDQSKIKTEPKVKIKTEPTLTQPPHPLPVLPEPVREPERKPLVVTAVTQLEPIVDKLPNALAVARKKAKGQRKIFKNKLKELRNEKNQLADNLIRSQRTATHLSEKLKETKIQGKQLEQQHSALTKELAIAREQLTEQNKKNKNLEETLTVERVSTRTQLKILTEERDKARSELRISQPKITSSEEKFTVVQSALLDRNKEFKEASKQIEQLAKENKRLAIEHKQLKSNLASARRERDFAQSGRETDRIANQTVVYETVKSFQKTVDQLKKQVAELSLATMTDPGPLPATLPHHTPWRGVGFAFTPSRQSAKRQPPVESVYTIPKTLDTSY